MPDTPSSSSQDTVFTGRTGAASLRELARDTVRAALRLDEGDSNMEGEVRALLRRSCELARTREARIEHLLVLLKDAWRDMPQARRQAHIEGQGRIERVVTLCIEEYFKASPRGR